MMYQAAKTADVKGPSRPQKNTIWAMGCQPLINNKENNVLQCIGVSMAAQAVSYDLGPDNKVSTLEKDDNEVVAINFGIFEELKVKFNVRIMQI